MIDDAAAPFERPVRRAVDDVAHLIDLDRAAVAGLDDQDVGMHAARDARAGGTDAARIGDRLAAGIGDLAKIETVQRLSRRRAPSVAS